jgi:hypothetical protein
MSSHQLEHDIAQYVEGWNRRNWVRTALTTLVGTGIILISGEGHSAIGKVILVLLGAFGLWDIVYSRRQLAVFSQGSPLMRLALNRREQTFLRLDAWIGYLGAVAVLAKLMHHSLETMDALALVFFLCAGLFIQFVLVRDAKRSGVQMEQYKEEPVIT